MKHHFPPAAGVACLTKRLTCAIRFRNKMSEGKISTEAIALILVRSDKPIFPGTARTDTCRRIFAVSPQMDLHALKNQETISTKVDFPTAVQHLTKALFLSKPVEPPLSY